MEGSWSGFLCHRPAGMLLAVHGETAIKIWHQLVLFQSEMGCGMAASHRPYTQSKYAASLYPTLQKHMPRT